MVHQESRPTLAPLFETTFWLLCWSVTPWFSSRIKTQFTSVVPTTCSGDGAPSTCGGDGASFETKIVVESNKSKSCVRSWLAVGLGLYIYRWWQAEHHERVEHCERVLVKEKVHHREREGRAQVWDLEKFYYYYYLNIVLTWKFVRASKASVLYIYIDETNFTDKHDSMPSS